ncbi:MAG: TolC family protein [candidate division Zixibacteria bacterium]|nr:TolC family protein [candidate division Zixibacteria bacterium]
MTFQTCRSRAAGLCLALAFLVSLPAPNLFGQPTAGQKWTLEQCIETALKNNMQLVIAARQVEVDEAQVYGAYTGVLPRLNATVLSSNRTTSGDRPLFQEGTFVRNVPGGTTTSYSNGITLNQTIYNGSQNWNNIRQEKEQVETSRWNVKSAEYTVTTNVKEQYYGLLRATRLKEVVLEQVKLSEEQLRRSESMFEIGLVAKVDVLQARAQLGQVRINLLNQDRTVFQARAALNNAMGLDVNTMIDVVDPIGDNPMPFGATISMEEATRIADANNPTVQRDESNIRTARIASAIAKGVRWPTVSGTAGYSRSGSRFQDVYGNLGKNWNLSLGLNVSVPVWNGTQISANIEQAQVNFMRSEENLEQTRRITRLTIKTALLNLETTRQVIELSNENIVAGEEGLRLAEERYRVGSGTLLDVFNAQVTLAQAKSNLVAARYDYLIAQANLDEALGRR